MTLWSKTALEDEWYNLEDPGNPEGLLPWGCPYIEFAVVIRQPLEGDVNGDGYVNIYDLLIVRDAIGSTPGDPNWNPDADIATGPPVTPGADGIVNIFDLLYVSYHLGETA